jgi:polyisoprenoid-binding protein YceI
MNYSFSYPAGLAVPAAASMAPVVAEGTQLQFDPAQTQIEFSLSDVLHKVHGAFRLKRGTLVFDAATGAISGQLVVDAASGASGSDGRDSRMHKNILESARYREIVFTPSRFAGEFHSQADSQLSVHGVLGIHGGDHEIDMPVKVHPDAGALTVDAEFPVPYVKWGMKNPSTLFLRVGDTVTIHIHGSATVSAAPRAD